MAVRTLDDQYVIVVPLTYFTVVVQLAFPFLLFNRITRRIALISILGMHVGIAVVMGFPFFSGIMASADAVLVSSATWITIVTWLGIQLRAVWRRIPIVKDRVRPEKTSGQNSAASPTELMAEDNSPAKERTLV